MLPRYGALGASSRLRSLQYVPFLTTAGFDVDVSSLLDDDYVRGMYAGRVSVPAVAGAYLRRLRRLMAARKYDVVWLEKEIWPWLPAALELAALPASTRLVVDYDDALFHRYDEHRTMLVRKVLGRKIDRVMRRANLVTAGNDYLAGRARTAGSRRIEWLPTVVDLDRYPSREPRPLRDEVVIGWIGSPVRTDYLHLVTPVMNALSRKYRIRCVAIGARAEQLAGTLFQAQPWSEKTEVQDLHGFDIGIMPLPDAPFERGKCGYKLIQYMACRLPVVASPVGVNREIVRVGENGFLAEGEAAWKESLETLVLDASLRARMGAVGRHRVEREFCLQVQGPRLAQMLLDLAAT